MTYKTYSKLQELPPPNKISDHIKIDARDKILIAARKKEELQTVRVPYGRINTYVRPYVIFIKNTSRILGDQGGAVLRTQKIQRIGPPVGQRAVQRRARFAFVVLFSLPASLACSIREELASGDAAPKPILRSRPGWMVSKRRNTPFFSAIAPYTRCIRSLISQPLLLLQSTSS